MRPGTAALAEIRSALVRAGLQRKVPGRILVELAVHVSLLAGGVVLFFAADGFAPKTAGLLVTALGSVGVGTNTHTSAHGATSERRWINDLLAILGYPILLGLSITYWRQKHNVLHHGSPNVDGVDPDHEFQPWFALADSQVGGSRLLRFYQRRIQGFLFMPVGALLMSHNMRVLGVAHAIGRLFKGPSRRATAADLGAFVLYVTLWWVLPWTLASPLQAVALNVGRDVLLSVALFLIFTPAHIPHSCAFYSKDAFPDDLVLRQAATTIDYRAGTLSSFFLSGLQFQLEHHLFPGLPHVHYRRLAPLVRETFARHGYPYRLLGWGEALAASARVAFHPKETVTVAPAGATES